MQLSYKEARMNYYLGEAVAQPENDSLRVVALEGATIYLINHPSDCDVHYNRLVLLCNHMVRLNRSKTDGEFAVLVATYQQTVTFRSEVPTACLTAPDQKPLFDKVDELLSLLQKSIDSTGKK
jgi:hypothetical protein